MYQLAVRWHVRSLLGCGDRVGVLLGGSLGGQWRQHLLAKLDLLVDAVRLFQLVFLLAEGRDVGEGLRRDGQVAVGGGEEMDGERNRPVTDSG